MKEILVILSMLLLATSCKENAQEKAQNLIEAYFNENVNDPSQFEIVSISELEPDSVSLYSQEFEYSSDQREFEHYYEMEQMAMDYGHLKRAEYWLAKIDSIDKEIDRKEKNFIPYQRGMFLKVKYRDTNEQGAKVLKEATFCFDNELTEITDVK